MARPSRATQKTSTRERIVEAAYGEFVTRGILATRMDDVAVAACVSHGTVFLHFKTQEALMEAVIGEYGGRVAQRMHELAEGGSTVREILAAHLEGISEFEPFYTRLAVEMRLLPEECRVAWLSLQSAVSFHIGRAAEKEMREGKIKDVPLHFLFNSWMGLVIYYLANGDLFAPNGSVIKRHGEELRENFMKLLTTEP